MRKVILTGATGFVGNWLLDDLLKSNVDVTIVVRDKKKLNKHQN